MRNGIIKPCQICGKDVYCTPCFPRKKYCSVECQRYPRKRITRKCLICQKEFFTTLNYNKRYCSKHCANKGLTKPLVIKECLTCKKQFVVGKKRKQVYCSYSCAGKITGAIMSEKRLKHLKALGVKLKGKKLDEVHRLKIKQAAFARWQKPEYRKLKIQLMQQVYQRMREKKPEEHPMWRGGISFEKYTPDFNPNFKRKIRQRDGFACLVCGLTEQENKLKYGRKLEVHHIDYNKKISTEENGVSVCKPCHMKTNYNREHWTKFFQSLLAERYGYDYSN